MAKQRPLRKTTLAGVLLTLVSALESVPQDTPVAPVLEGSSKRSKKVAPGGERIVDGFQISSQRERHPVSNDYHAVVLLRECMLPEAQRNGVQIEGIARGNTTLGRPLVCP